MMAKNTEGFCTAPLSAQLFCTPSLVAQLFSTASLMMAVCARTLDYSSVGRLAQATCFRGRLTLERGG